MSTEDEYDDFSFVPRMSTPSRQTVQPVQLFAASMQTGRGDSLSSAPQGFLLSPVSSASPASSATASPAMTSSATASTKPFFPPTAFPPTASISSAIAYTNNNNTNQNFQISAAQCKTRLMRFIRKEKKGLKEFFSTVGTVGSALDRLNAPSRAAAMVDGLLKDGCPKEMALRFTALTMYDLVVLLDDSDSMELEENGDRPNTLRQVLESVAKIYTYARPEGIVSVRFFNTRQGTRNVTPEKVEGLLGEVEYSGLTMIGTQLKKKILEPFVFNRRGGTRMQKPLLVMVITDGDVEGENMGFLKKTITNCIARAKEDPLLGEHAVAFYFARVGDDEGAKDLIESLDNDKSIGNWIDCFPAKRRIEEINDHDKLKKWNVLAKLLLGALYADIDENDDPVEDEEEQMEVEEPPTTEDGYLSDKD